MNSKLFLPLILSSVSLVVADGPADNRTDRVRPIPPPGVEVPADQRIELESGLRTLGEAIEQTRRALREKPDLTQWLPDVEIFYKAVHDALAYDEFYDLKREWPAARECLRLGMDRARLLREGLTPWLEETGLIPRGYRSRLDGSVQPFGLVVPSSFQPNTPTPWRLDFWFHGRGEKLTELSFLNQRMRDRGQFTPPHGLVLHLYGRYCNANKLAGEVDLFEALEQVQRHIAIDPNRMTVRGFSMGGAACWQFAVHYPGRWAAAAPGAGFSETPEFLKVFQNETLQPTWYEKKLWHWYDCTDYAANLYHCPTVAYSGENDRQMQAALAMQDAMAKEGLTLTHIIGPGMGHQYHPDSKKEIDRRIDAIVAAGRDPMPRRVRFTTWTLRYHQAYWIVLEGLKEHWTRTRVEAEILDDTGVRIQTENVTRLRLEMEPGLCPLDATRRPVIIIDGTELAGSPVGSDRSWSMTLAHREDAWHVVGNSEVPPSGYVKKPGLQGPIDDAFLDSFLMVRPTGDRRHANIANWVDRELAHATNQWRSQFRGLARIKDDIHVTEEDLSQHNLILWGDPSSNRYLARIADRLPVQWNEDALTVGTKTFSPDRHVPLLIYPNPLNPERYVVLNSGFTFREYDYLNNARQVPKLPDYAVVDIDVPASPRWPGGIVDAGFFDEDWSLK